MQLGYLEASLRILLVFRTDARLYGLLSLVKTTTSQECSVSSGKEASSKTAIYTNNNSSCSYTTDIELRELTISKIRS